LPFGVGLASISATSCDMGTKVAKFYYTGRPQQL